MSDTLQQVLDTPGCERLRDFAAVGPAQRAALELFVDRLRAADQQAEPVLILHRCPSKGLLKIEYTDEVTELDDGVYPLFIAPPKAAPEATQYIALCDAMGYNERKDSLTSPEEHAQSLVAEIKRLKERAAPMSEEEIVVMFDEMVNRAAPRDFIVKFARAIEARKARP